jgi:GMP synthase-like glutamine amidotransferase
MFSGYRKELAHVFGGEVAPGQKREYGKAQVHRSEGCDSRIFEGLPDEFQMWMSHGDKLHKVPDGFKKVGKYDHTFHNTFNMNRVDPNFQTKCNFSWNLERRLCCDRK